MISVAVTCALSIITLPSLALILSERPLTVGGIQIDHSARGHPPRQDVIGQYGDQLILVFRFEQVLYRTSRQLFESLYPSIVDST
jgi:hypothetical protein